MLSLNDLLKLCLREASIKGKKICIQTMGELDENILKLLESKAIETVKGANYTFKYKDGLIQIYTPPKREEGIYTYYRTVKDFNEIYLPLSCRLNKTLAAIKNITRAEIYIYNDYTISEINQILENLSLDDKRKVLQKLKKSIEKQLDEIRYELR